MLRKMFQGGSSKKKPPRLVICEPDLELPRYAQVRPCEWPSDDFMTSVGFKDEFYAYVHKAELTDFVSDKCPQYYNLTNSFVRGFKYSVQRNTHSVLFYLYDNHLPWS